MKNKIHEAKIEWATILLETDSDTVVFVHTNDKGEWCVTISNSDPLSWTDHDQVTIPIKAAEELSDILRNITKKWS